MEHECYCQTINNLIVKVKKLDPDVQLPTRGSAAAAGYDLYANEDMQIGPFETKLIGTGLSFALPEGTFLGIYARSGLATKQGLRPANCTGVIDSDYRGEVKVALHNDMDNIVEIKKGDRIAQGILHTYIPMNFIEVEDLDETKRGIGRIWFNRNK